MATICGSGNACERDCVLMQAGRTCPTLTEVVAAAIVMLELKAELEPSRA